MEEGRRTHNGDRYCGDDRKRGSGRFFLGPRTRNVILAEIDQSRTWFRYGAVTVHYGLGSRIGECAGLRKRISTPRRQHSRDERCCYFENRTRWRNDGFGGSFQSPAVWPYCTFGSDGECPLVWRGENCGKSGTAGLVSKFKAESKPKLRIERLHLQGGLVTSSLSTRRGTAFIRCGHGLAVQVNMKKCWSVHQCRAWLLKIAVGAMHRRCRETYGIGMVPYGHARHAVGIQ